MKQKDVRGQRFIALFLLGCLLFNYPLLAVFSRHTIIFGIPLLYVYLFSAWLGLIVLIVLIMEKPR